MTLPAVKTTKPAPVTHGFSCRPSVTNNGMSELRTPSEAQLSARFATAAARNAGSRSAARRSNVGADVVAVPVARPRGARGSSITPTPPAAASVAA
jgi:hypothetical protein